MKIIGLTGGIGMGKTTAAGILRQRGIPVTDSDEIARGLTQAGQPVLEEIRRVFGNGMIRSDGQLHRGALARIVFSDPCSRKKLEDILHPRIRRERRARLDVWRSRGEARAVAVVPLLFETGEEKGMETTICVACEKATQRERLRQRGWSADQIRSRIEAQLSIEEKMSRADIVIWSEGSVAVLAEQLARVIPM